jgi:cold shock CspA family protein
MIGVCNFWNTPRGFGFLTAHDGEQYFLHITNFTRAKSPVRGAYIYFELGEPVKPGMKLQAVAARYAEPLEVKMAGGQMGRYTNAADTTKTRAGVNALGGEVRS